MSDTSVQSSSAVKPAARPVSLFTIIGVFILFAAAFLVARQFYRPTAVAPQNAAPENLTKDLQWRATAESRREALAQLKQEQTHKLETYSWIDQKAGVVQLPIERAMELTAQKYGSKQ